MCMYVCERESVCVCLCVSFLSALTTHHNTITYSVYTIIYISPKISMTTAESEKNGPANKTKIEIWKQAHYVHWQGEGVAIVADSIICTFCNERRIILRDASNVCLLWLICTRTHSTHTNRAISKFGQCEPTSRETQGSCFLFVSKRECLYCRWFWTRKE